MADGAVAGVAALLPGLDHRRPGRADHRGVHRWVPAAADDSGRAPRPAGGDGHRVLRRSGRGRRAGGGAAQGFRTAVAGLCTPTPYLALQSMLDPSFPHGRWYYMRACDVAELSDEVIDIAAERGLAIDSPFTSYPIFQLGGAISRVLRTVRRSAADRAGTPSTSSARRPARRVSPSSASGSATRGGRSNRTSPGCTSTSSPTRAPTDPVRVRRPDVRPAHGAEAEVRPGQPVPPEPEHPARLTRSYRSTTNWVSSGVAPDGTAGRAVRTAVRNTPRIGRRVVPAQSCRGSDTHRSRRCDEDNGLSAHLCAQSLLGEI